MNGQGERDVWGRARALEAHIGAEWVQLACTCAGEGRLRELDLECPAHGLMAVRRGRYGGG